MTSRELFEILEDLIKENGFHAVKDIIYINKSPSQHR